MISIPKTERVNPSHNQQEEEEEEEFFNHYKNRRRTCRAHIRLGPEAVSRQAPSPAEEAEAEEEEELCFAIKEDLNEHMQCLPES